MRVSTSPKIFLLVFLSLLIIGGFLIIGYLFPDPAHTTAKYFAYCFLAIIFLTVTNLIQLLHTTGTARIIAAAMNEDLTASNELFHELYKNSPVPYLRMKRNGTIISVNNAMLRFFKVEEGRLDGLDIFSLLTVSDTQKSELLPTLIRRGQYINDEEISTQNTSGAIQWALLSSFPYGHNQESLLTLFDITKQKEVDKAKSEFVSLASHQLRTPISAMRWNIELMAGENLGPLTVEQKAYLQKISRNTEKMNLIINDFLDVSQLEMGTFATEIISVELNSFLEKIYEEFTERIARKNISFNKNYPGGTLTLKTDEHLLHNAISNLVSNAVKYTPDTGAVTVAYTADQHQITFTVTDTGMGIPEAEQTQLFSKFFRATNAKNEVTEGTGLGLYIVSQAIEKLGGTIAVQSVINQGTTFTVSIPRT